MSSRTRTPSKPTTFALLMVLAVLLTLLPDSVARWRQRIVQAFVHVTYPAAQLGHAVRDGAESLTASAPSPEAARAALRRAEELERALLQQQLLNAELRRRLAEAGGLQTVLAATGGRARIVAAIVRPGDADPRRRSIQIGLGSVGGVQVGQWVAAGVTPDDVPAEWSREELLARLFVIGQVDEVASYSSRALLTTDPRFRTSVRPVRVLADGNVQLAEHDEVLDGRGAAGMVLSRATRDYPAEGFRYVVQRLTADYRAMLTIGAIEASKPVDDAPLHFDIPVRPLADAYRLGYVWVIVTEQARPAEPGAAKP